MAVDSEGNAIVTGSSVGGDGSEDIYTAKYAAADGALIWEQRFNGPSNLEDSAAAVLVDSFDNVIVAGTSTDAATYLDFYTAKYKKADGSLLWEKRYSSPGHFGDYVSGAALDGEGNVLVTGPSFGVNVFADYYTVKYAAANGAVLWEKRYNGPDSPEEWPAAIAVDSAGNAIVTGYERSVNVTDILTIKYAAANGALLWEKRYDSPMHHADEGRGVVVDKAGNVFVTGSSFTQSTSYDYYTAKYAAADGALLWERRYDGPSSLGDEASALAVDGSGNVVVTGHSTRYGTREDYYTAKYAGETGALLWERRYSPPAHLTDKAQAIALDGSGNVIVTGYSYTSITGLSNFDFATVKYAIGPNLDIDNDGLLDSWEIAHFGTTVGHSALDDNDNDGRVELNELAFNTNPTVPETNGTPNVVLDGRFLTVTIAKQPGVSYLVQTSFTPSDGDFTSKTTEILIDNATTLKVRDTVLLNEDEEYATERFLRVKVTAAP